ncbi:MAG: ShlB/FhaC/HecB family hemolysin secretion/activation protein [Parachlamydiales bacterium]|nr:ShlB/FhaC/HecB family hemolysin secretion/activation protein [Parachlamydiales bacterium]
MNRVVFFTFFIFWAFSGYCDEQAIEEIKKEAIPKKQFETQKINSIYIFEKDQKIENFSEEGIFIEADEKFSKEKLKNDLLPFLKKEINEQNISNISKTIKEFFKNSNYPFVLVSLPAQKIDNGTIKFIITESKLGAYEVIGNKNFTKKIFQKYLDLKDHDPIDVQRINRHIQLINKNPFRNVNILFKPGKEINTTDIDVLVKDRIPYRIYGGIDNTGLVSTGFNRIFAGLNLGNLWRLDHIFSYQFTSASNINEFQSHTISYTLPVFYKNFITVFSGYSKIRPDQQINYLNNHGKSFQASFRYAFLLNPTRKLNHEVDVGFDYKYSNINLTYRSSPIIKNRVNIT